MRTILAIVLILSIMLTGASVAEEKPIVKVLILPKFEVGKMYGDYIFRRHSRIVTEK